MIEDHGLNHFQVRCDLCGKWHPLIGTYFEVEDQGLKDGYIEVEVTYRTPHDAERKTFCPECAKQHFGKTFEEVFDPDPAYPFWQNN